MIKTLKITGFLAVIAAIGCVVMLAMIALKGDPGIQKLLASESVVEIFKKKTTKATSSNDQVSPLVKQAKKLALRINPPAKPKPEPVKTTKKQTSKTSRPSQGPKPTKINTKFNLVATCKYEDQPEKSMALLDMPAKGLEWYRLGQEVNHLTIHQINDGNIILYKGGVQNSIVEMPVINTKSLLKSDSLGQTNVPAQMPVNPEFPMELFQKLTNQAKDAETEQAETPKPNIVKPGARTFGNSRSRTVRRKRPQPQEVSEKNIKATRENTISNIKRIMSENESETDKEANETFRKLLETLEADEQAEEPAK